MGDPRRIRSKFSGPAQPWNKERIESEKKLLLEFGLKNKWEVYKLVSKLRTFMKQAKRLIALENSQADREKKQLLGKLCGLGLVSSDAKLDDVLGLTLNDLLKRRLQTFVVKKGLARSMRQSRQMIAHEHIMVGSKKISSPAYLVSIGEEASIGFAQRSPFVSTDHPERQVRVVKPDVAKTDVKKEGAA